MGIYPLPISKEGSGDGHLSPQGPRWGNLEGGFFTRDFERQVKEGSGDGASLSVGALRGEPGRVAPLLGTYKRYVKESSGNGTSLSMKGLRKGNLEGGYLYWGL
jgi:hypothetical protein